MPASVVLNRSVVALLGRQDKPTDGVEDYCVFLAKALAQRAIVLERNRISRDETGWRRALQELSRRSTGWRGKWVFLQYTALAWPFRGFPAGILGVARILKNSGARVAVVFHESKAVPAKGMLGPSRFVCQEWVIRRLYKVADCAILTVPTETLRWVPRADSKAHFIPIGANIPELPAAQQKASFSNGASRTVGVFCVTEGVPGFREVQEISGAMRQIRKQIQRLRLIVFGRGATEAGATLRTALEGCDIELAIHGVLPAEEVTQILSTLDALLYVRGEVSPQRGCVIAAISCGVPLVGYGDYSKSFPASAAGVLLASPGDSHALSTALGQVLTNSQLWHELQEKNRRAYKEFFSWEAIAGRYAEMLRDG